MSDEFEEVFQKNFPHLYGAAKAGEPEANGDMSNARWGWNAAKKHSAPPTTEWCRRPKVVCEHCIFIWGMAAGIWLGIALQSLR